jgi:hypothetical protein
MSTRIRKPNGEGYMSTAEFRDRIRKLVRIKTGRVLQSTSETTADARNQERQTMRHDRIPPHDDPPAEHADDCQCSECRALDDRDAEYLRQARAENPNFRPLRDVLDEGIETP